MCSLLSKGEHPPAQGGLLDPGACMQCYFSPLRGAAGWLVPRGPVSHSGSNTGPIIHSTLFTDPRRDNGDTELGKPSQPLCCLMAFYVTDRETKSQHKPIFQEPLRSHPQRDPRQPQLLSHNTYPAGLPEPHPEQMAQWLRIQALESPAAYLLCDLGQVT